MLGVSVLMLTTALSTQLPSDSAFVPHAVHVSIEQESGAALPLAELRAVAVDIERIWRPFVEVIATVGNGPAGMLAREHVRLVISARTLQSADAAGIGWIEFVGGQPKPVMTVSLAAVTQLLVAGSWSGRPFTSLPARASLLFRQRAIARAAAHELGHYLLRTKEHARSGLMRAVYTVDQIMSSSARHSRLPPVLIASLQREQPVQMTDRHLSAHPYE